MNPQTLYNPQTGIKATPLPGVTQQQTQAAMTQGFQPIMPSKDTSTQINTGTIGTNPVSLPQAEVKYTPPPLVGAPAGTITDPTTGSATTPPETGKSQKSPYESILSQFEGLGSELDKKGAATAKLQEEQQIAQKRQQATVDYNNYLQAKLGLQAQVDALYNSGGTQEGIARQVQELTRKGNSNLANLALISQVSQGLLTNAEQTIKDKLDAQFSPIEDKINYLTKFAQLNANDLTEKEKYQLDQQARKQEKEYDQMYETTSNLHSVLLQNGAPSTVFAEMDDINDEYVTGKITAAQARAKMAEVARKNMVAAPTTMKAPEVKNINGVDMQWNGSSWEAINTGGAGGVGGAGGTAMDNTQKSIEQMSFLRTTVQNAKDLASASGASGVSRFLGDTFVGDTEYRQLEQYTNTLKTNLLTLMTDPNVKKFFGPQMSNADVMLMTSAGTTLNPQANSPKQMKDELIRVDNLLNRMQTAVELGVNPSQNLITAPNGEVIQITD